MIFGKKNNSLDEDTLRNETHERYRQTTSSAYKSPLPDPLEKVGEVKIKGQAESTPQWPNPRASIKPEQEIDLQSSNLLSEEAAIEPLYKPIVNSTSSKLAQFVATGLSNVGLKQQNKVAENIKPLETPKVNDSYKAAISTAFANTNENIKLTPEDEIKKKYGSNLKSALGLGTIIEGTFSFETPVCIEGTLLGEIRSNSLLIVGPEASVQAKIKVGSLVYGVVRGDVEAQELVNIKENGTLEGNVLAEKLAIEEGGWFQGRCIPSAPSKILEQFSRKRNKENESVESPNNNKISSETKATQQELNIQKLQTTEEDNLLLPEDQIELSSLEKWSL